jgi:hypothetical protein
MPPMIRRPLRRNVQNQRNQGGANVEHGAEDGANVVPGANDHQYDQDN